MKKVFIIQSSIFFLFFLSCNDGERNLNIEIGKATYKAKCLPCHNFQNQNTEYDPSLRAMLEMNSINIENKINYLLRDSLHHPYVHELNRQEVENLKHFLKEYDGIEY